MTTATRTAWRPRWALAFLASVLAVLIAAFGAAPASAATTRGAQDGVGASTSAGQVAVGLSASISAGQQLGSDPPRPQIVVATGVAAGTAVRGGAGPVRQGAAGVQRTIDDLEAAGGRVLGREVTVEAGGVRTRPDLFVELPCGTRCFLEVKTGPGAGLTPNQTVGFPAIRSGGAVPRGGNAAAAGLTPGVPMGPTPVWVVHQPWPLQ